jgi:hypothetical protein
MFDTASHTAAIDYANSSSTARQIANAIHLLAMVANADESGAQVTEYARRWADRAAEFYGARPRLFAAGVIPAKL